ncbi:unnamed protein product, partial [Mesorhabditis spiculigera]
MPERPPCYVLFYIDASLEAEALDVSMKEEEKAFVLEVSESLYSHPQFSLQVALAAYGDDNYGTPDLNTTYDRRTQLSSALDAWSLLDPNSEDIKNATTGLKVIGTWEHYFYVVLMSASPESVIKTADNSAYYPWTIGVALAEQNMGWVAFYRANLTMKATTEYILREMCLAGPDHTGPVTQNFEVADAAANNQ